MFSLLIHLCSFRHIVLGGLPHHLHQGTCNS
jgi:hypothetical protein